MSAGVSHLNYIEPHTLKAWIDASKSETAEGKFVVIDVRDSDYIGGHIKNSKNYPYNHLSANLSQLCQEIDKGNYNDVIFHCLLSQQRGPSLAMKYIRTLDEAQLNSENFKVWILRGGFTKWQQLYGEDPSLTDGYIKDLWC